MSVNLRVGLNTTAFRSFERGLKVVEDRLLQKLDEFVINPLFEEIKIECPRKSGKLLSSLRKKSSLSKKRLTVHITSDGAKNETGRSYLPFILEGQKALSSRGRYIPGIGKRRRARKAMDTAVQGTGGSVNVGDTQKTVEFRSRAKGIKTSQFNSMGRYPKRAIPPNPFHKRAHDKWLRTRAPQGLKKLQEWITQQLTAGKG